MKSKLKEILNETSDHQWFLNGQSAFSGTLLKLYYYLDKLFLSWAKDYGANDHLFPSFIAAQELKKLDYFRSFPHLITFPVTLKQQKSNLEQFISEVEISQEKAIGLTATEPIYDVLTPAACYHFYIHYQNANFDRPKYVTTQANCFRKESYYLPLERQWHFRMREIVCIGTADEVQAFLASFRHNLTQFFERIQLPIAWQPATDSFFEPCNNPKYFAQKVESLKTEMVFDEQIAIGSLNYHRNFFGDKFQIFRDGKEAFSGCVAFGIERWMLAFLTQFGGNEEAWKVFDLEITSNE